MFHSSPTNTGPKTFPRDDAPDETNRCSNRSGSPRTTRSFRSKNSATSSSKRKNRTRRRIRFDEAVNVRPCLCRDDYAPDEIGRTWYSRQDYQQMRAEQSQAIGFIERYNPALVKDTPSTSFRGLESYTRAGIEERKVQVFRSVQAVLELQTLQRSEIMVSAIIINNNNKLTSEEKIRQIYQYWTTQQQIKALQRAEKDEKTVSLMIKKTRREVSAYYLHNDSDDSASTSNSTRTSNVTDAAGFFGISRCAASVAPY